MSKPRHYDPEYKAQAVKLAQELGSANKAAKELGISKDIIYGWIKASREGRLNVEIARLKKELEKEGE